MMTALLIVMRNLRRHKVRATMSFLAVLLAGTLFHIYVGARHALDEVFNGSALRNTLFVKPTHGALWDSTLPNAYAEEVQKVPGVLAATSECNPDAHIGEDGVINIVGIDPAQFRAVAGSDLDNIPPDVYERFASDPTAAIVSHGVRLQYGLEVGKRYELPLVDTTDIATRPGYVAPQNPTLSGHIVAEATHGVYSERLLIVHIETCSRALNTNRGIGVQARLAPGADPGEVSERISNVFKGREEVEGMIMETWAGSLKNFLEQLISVVLGFVAFVGVLAIGILSHSVSMASFELRPQIGALRALGTSRLATLFVLTGEGIVVTFAGTTLATAVLWLTTSETNWLNLKSITMLAASFTITPINVVQVYLMSAVVVLLGAVLPSFAVTRAPIASLLRRRD